MTDELKCTDCGTVVDTKDVNPGDIIKHDCPTTGKQRRFNVNAKTDITVMEDEAGWKNMPPTK
jgi:hypothetical protein